ncbi:uncharacterized protein LOC109246041 isoform X2 [Panthera pardus]|uniref:Uncharacterized protein LOC109246041 isoform X2 n=1 Tax=Panthera pardus TaxID=9691 RepID=A0A9V1DX51_PANPR|nr:uncharacterized protein LOC109246041 isoform X2 [Panthera pardus]
MDSCRPSPFLGSGGDGNSSECWPDGQRARGFIHSRSVDPQVPSEVWCATQLVREGREVKAPQTPGSGREGSQGPVWRWWEVHTSCSRTARAPRSDGPLPRDRRAWALCFPDPGLPGLHPEGCMRSSRECPLAVWALPAREEVPAQPPGRANTSGRSGPLDYLLGTNFLPQKNHRLWRKNKQPFGGAALGCPQEGSRSQKSPRGSQAPRAQRPRELVDGCPGQCRPPAENACADRTDRELQAGRQSGPGPGSGTAGVHALGKVSGRHQEPTRAHRKAGTPGYTHFLSGRAGWWGGYRGACGAWPAAPGSPMGHRAGPEPHRCPLLVDGRWTGPPRPRGEKKPTLVSPEPLAAPSLPGDSRPLLPGP